MSLDSLILHKDISVFEDKIDILFQYSFSCGNSIATTVIGIVYQIIKTYLYLYLNMRD